jgi:LPS export ABC transporter protein LptC
MFLASACAPEGNCVAGKLIGTFIALWSLALLPLGCGSSSEFAAMEASERPSLGAELQGVVFEGHSAGSQDVEVRAKRAWVDPAERRVDLQEVQIGFEDEKRGAVRIRAERAQLQLDSDDFVLRGEVVGTTGEGEQFKTAEVRYQQGDQLLWTDQPVQVNRSNLLLKGGAMQMHVPSRRIRLTGNVRATVEPQ